MTPLLLALALAGCSDDDGPAVGTERGPCYPNNTCNAGLTCLSGLCVRPNDGGVDAAGDGTVLDGQGPADGDVVVPDAPGPGQVTTLAGSGSPGAQDGTGAAASFNFPTGVALSPAGDKLFVADRDNHAIRVVSIATGAVTTLAGSGVQGYADGSGTAAQFSAPTAVAVGSKGEIYVADAGNNRIRKIVGDQVTTFAGSGVAGSSMGSLLTATFNSPRGVTVDPWGVVYVTDFLGNSLRKITTTVSSITPSGLSGAAGLNSDGQGVIYIAEMGRNRIERYTTSVTTFAGSSVKGTIDGDALFAKFNDPAGVAVTPSGTTAWVADTGNHRIRKVAADKVTTLCGSTAGFKDGKLADALFNAPYGIAVDSSGRLFVADTNNHRIRMIVP